jgi:hypothetical protein
MEVVLRARRNLDVKLIDSLLVDQTGNPDAYT